MLSRDVPIVVPIIVGAVFVVLVLVNVVLVSALLQHRTDVPRNAVSSGPSRFWQVNMLVHATYDPRGQTIKRWMVGVFVTQCLVGALLIIIWTA